MKCQLSFLFLLAVGAYAHELEVTPVQKVVQLLEGMLAKGKEEKHAEQVSFAAEKQFCDDTSVEKKRSIAQAGMEIESLAAQIGKATADAARLTREIAHHAEDESVWRGDTKAANQVRAIEKADYDAVHKDYSESIDAIGRAVMVLKKQTHDRTQSASLAQVASMNLIPTKAKKAIEAFLQQSGDAADMDAPEANAYEFQSSGVVEMLQKLQDKFIDERTTHEKEEANSKHAHNMLIQDLEAQIAQAEKENSEKSEVKAKTLQRKAEANGDRADTMSTQAEDKKYLHDLTADCAMKASDFESRQQLRSEEIVSIEKAVEIISSGSVAGNADRHLPSFLQKKGSSLGQLRSNSNTRVQNRAAQYLREQAAKFNSRVLADVAQRVEADPFTKIKKMIKGLIVRLMEEANQEADHKGWCDTELSTNAQTRTEKTQAVETLHAEIDELGASIAKVTEDIADLTQAVAELSSAMAEATKLRTAEKAQNAATVSDAQEAQTAVAQALTVLKEFYAKAAEATSFAQMAAPYNGMQSENGGVVGMLEVIESDFARLESETKAAEASGQKEYDTFMTDSKADKASKSTSSDHKTAKKQDQSQALTEKKRDLDGTQKELDASLSYFDKLKPSCVDSGVSYEDRVSRRKEEVESLQEALKIINGEDFA